MYGAKIKEKVCPHCGGSILPLVNDLPLHNVNQDTRYYYYKIGG